MPLPLLGLAGLAVQMAPTIAGWFGGDKAEDTIKRVTDAAGAIFGTTNPDEIEAAIATDPQKALEFRITVAKIADEQNARLHAERLAEMKAQTDRQAQILADSQNARNQTIELAKAGSAIAWGAPIISVLVTVGYFVTLFIVLLRPFPIDASMRDVILVLLGALQIAFGQVVNYWLGSSAGSATKDRQLQQVRANDNAVAAAAALKAAA
jgi:hypothetical protein